LLLNGMSATDRAMFIARMNSAHSSSDSEAAWLRCGIEDSAPRKPLSGGDASKEEFGTK
jgi:hypothetical protein